MLTFASLLGIWSAAGAILSLQAAPVVAPELFESLPGVPEGWSKVADPEPSERLYLRIALQQQNVAQFEQALLDVSTPDHPNYGLHLKRDELKAMLRPRESAIRSVLDWLSSSGIASDDILNDGDWINFHVTVEKANAMMDTEFAVYRNSVNKAERIRTLEYSLPKALHKDVVMIQPTTRFGQIRAERSWTIDQGLQEKATGARKWHGVEVDIAACNATITPACLQALYNIGDFKADPNSGSKLGIAGYLEQYAKYDALETFLAEYAPYASGTNFSVVGIAGGLNTQNSTIDDKEANLDIQYGVSMSYPVPNTYYTTAGRGLLVPDLDQPDASQNSNEPYLEFLTHMLGLPDSELPQTLTTSYGEDEQSVPESYSRSVCNMFGQLGARGVSVLFSSGDTGVGSACQTNDGKNTTRFLPIFPAACPWVTSVGGTYKVKPERAIAFSSGGFSDRFPRPAYQDKAVQKYLSILGDRWQGLYNPDGRGFPDVAAQSYRFHYIDQGQEGLIGGTSASAPVFAALVSLLNAARLSAKQPPMGFLNPWIYSVGRHALHDIVDGGSKGCTGMDVYSGLPTPFVPYASWNATDGWDPVTGYGTPNFQYLLKLSTPSAAKAMMRRNFEA